MRYKLNLDDQDFKNLKEFGLPISNSLTLVLSESGELEVQEWPGGGGSYFSSKENEFPGIKGLDQIELTLPDGSTLCATVPFSYGPYPKLEEEE
jgi:hypothetical protein